MLELLTAIRALRRTPGFALAGISTLAIAAGAVNAILAVVSSVLLAPLPIRDERKIVVAWKHDMASGYDHWPFTYPAVRSIEKLLTTVTEVATVDYNGAYPLSLVEGDQGHTILTGIISGNLMRVLGIEPILGRTIQPSDDVVGAPRVAVLSEAFWKTRYAGDPGALGRTFTMHGESYEIVGVVRGGFGVPAATVMWIAQKPLQPQLIDSELYVLADLVVRLKPGVTIEQFRLDLEAARSRSPSETIEAYKAHKVVITPLREKIVSDARPMLLLLATGALLVLVVAAANLGGLFLVRSGGRVHEIAIRAAIGGGMLRSLKTLIMEFGLVVAAGVALGVPAGWAMLRLLGPFLPAELPAPYGISLEPIPVLVTTLICAAIGLLGGAAPVVALGRADLVSALKSGGRGAARGWGMHPIRRVMVAAQVALAVIIVAGSGLLLRTLEQMQRIDPGFRPEGVLFMDLADSRKVDTMVAPRRNEVDRFVEKLSTIPGVTSVGAVFSPPFVGTAGFYVKLREVGTSTEAAERMPYANTDVIHPGSSATLGLRLVKGRLIDPSDRENTPIAVVLNETLARTIFQDRDPIGKLVRPPSTDTTVRAVVVGVVADTRYNELLRPAPMAYFSYRQLEWIPQNYVIRTANDAAARALIPQIRQAVQEVEPAIAVRRALPLSEMLGQPLARPRLAALLVTGFALVVLTLAAVGIYSVMASFVVQRTREIGVRMALGATGPMVHGLVFRQGMVLTAIGLVVGLVAALLGGRVLQSMLYEVTATDPLTFVAVALLLLIVAAGAVVVPSIRAARLEPVDALRSE
jgi:putative ABC transport system permease protein